MPNLNAINKPVYYNNHPSGVECREITRHLNNNLGCAFKYVFRYRYKESPWQDLQKSVNYLTDELVQIEADVSNKRVLLQPELHSQIVDDIKKINDFEGLTIVKVFYSRFVRILVSDQPIVHIKVCIKTLNTLASRLEQYKNV